MRRKKTQKWQSKGGIKMHTVINVDEVVPNLVWFSPATTHDHQYLQKITCDDKTIYVFDKGFNDYKAFTFTKYRTSFVQFYKSINNTSVLIITPINEVSFLSWLGGDVKGTSPFCTNQGWEVKYNLMRAYIKGIEALKVADSQVIILTTEPLVNIIAKQNATSNEINTAQALHQSQFEVTEILCGRMCPELGGKIEYLDILGYNYYYNNQWIADPHQCLNWKMSDLDNTYIPLHSLIFSAYTKYKRPIVIAETSHPGVDRPLWIKMIETEIQKIIEAQVPMWGVCWYPILNRPDWDFLENWHYSGIWDDVYTVNNSERILNTESAKAILNAQQAVRTT